MIPACMGTRECQRACAARSTSPMVSGREAVERPPFCGGAASLRAPAFEQGRAVLWSPCRRSEAALGSAAWNGACMASQN